MIPSTDFVRIKDTPSASNTWEKGLFFLSDADSANPRIFIIMEKQSPVDAAISFSEMTTKSSKYEVSGMYHSSEAILLRSRAVLRKAYTEAIAPNGIEERLCTLQRRSSGLKQAMYEYFVEDGAIANCRYAESKSYVLPSITVLLRLASSKTSERMSSTPCK